MKTIWQGRISRAAAKYGENARMAATYCNACRTCVQTNQIAGTPALAVAAGAGAVRFAPRFDRSA